MKFVFALFVMIAGCLALTESAASSIPHFPIPRCTFYCREGRDFVCCKNGKCPPRRDQCPPNRFHLAFGPQLCHSDFDCHGRDKCCHDACFPKHEKICKPRFEH